MKRRNDPSLDVLSKQFREFVSPYESPDSAADRHGSWELVATRQDSLRFVILALTELGSIADVAPWYDLEVWAGADDGARFKRELVSQFSAGAPSVEAEGFTDRLGGYLQLAVKRADSITPSDLTEVYLPSPRRRRAG